MAESQARLGLALAAYHVSDYAVATAEATRAHELFEASGDRLEAARANEVLGFVAIEKGQLPAARAYYEASLAVYTALGADADRASTLINIAHVLPAADPDEFRVLDEALALARSLSSPGLEARTLHARADHHFNAGRFDDAVRDLSLAIEKFKEANKTTSLADAYVSLGRLYRAHGQADRAIEFYDLAAEIQERTGELRGLVQSVNAKAIALGILNRVAESRQAYERALAFAHKTGSARIINFQQGNLAAAYAAAGDRAGAIRLLEDVITRETDPYLLAYRYGNLAWYYLQEQQPETALPHADRSIEHATTAGNRDYLVTLFYNRAAINRALGRFDAALEDAREGVRRVEEIRARLVPLDFMKRGFSELHQAMFGFALALSHQRGQAEQALLLSEQARARAFLDLLASRDLVASPKPAAAPAPPAAAVPADPAPSGSAPSGIRGSGERGAPAPPAADLALASYAAANTASAADIGATAARLRTTLLAYWVNDDEVLAWIVRPGHAVESVRIAVKRADLERMVQAAVPKPDMADPAPFRRLYTLLVAPVSKWLPPAGSSLTIVPHGPLFRVSFAALADPRGTYLVERYAIGYGPSASAFAFTDRLAQRSRSRAPVNSLVVADPSPVPTRTGQEPLPALAAAMREASAIRQVLGRDQTTVLVRAQALESDVRRELSDKRVVHFATHGVIRDDEPLESYLALGGAGDSPLSDGRLTVRELYDLSLSSEIVVLSACRTATGRPSGDGIAGMARALFYAGTPTVVATLWDVADQPSATLMGGFYSHWLRGLDKRAALRRAQLDLLGKLRAGSMVVKTPVGNVRLDARPFYWAGYALIGEPF